MSFYIGQRVKRRTDVYDDKSPMRYGIVINRYGTYGTQFGDYPELYTVQWDDGKRERGFLPHGLHDALDENYGF